MRLLKTIPLVIFIMLLFFLAYQSIEIKPRVRQWQQDLDVSFLHNSSSLIHTGNIHIPNENYLLYVFSSWCGNCRDGYKALMELKQKENVKIIGLAWKDEKDKVVEMLKNEGNPFHDLAILNEQEFVSLGLSSVPEAFVVNGKNKVILKISGTLTEELFNDIRSQLK